MAIAITTLNFVEATSGPRSQAYENAKNNDKKDSEYGGGGGSFTLDIYDKELYENLDIKARQAYEMLACKTYDNDDVDESIKLYIKNAKALDKAYGPLMDKAGNDRKILNLLSKYIKEDGVDEDTKKYILSQLDDRNLESTYSIIENLFNEVNGNITDQNKFWLPDMGEFYLGNVDTKLLEKIDKAMREKKDGMKAAHYTSLAPQDTLGYDKEKNMHFLKFNIDLSKDDIDKTGIIDGNHIRLSLDKAITSENDDTSSLEVLKSTIEKINKTNYFEKLFPESNNYDFNIDIVGITAPKVPKWCIENNVNTDDVTFEEFHKGDIKAENGFVFLQEDYDKMGSDDKMLFVRVMNTWRQVAITENKSYEVHGGGGGTF